VRCLATLEGVALRVEPRFRMLAAVAPLVLRRLLSDGRCGPRPPGARLGCRQRWAVRRAEGGVQGCGGAGGSLTPPRLPARARRRRRPHARRLLRELLVDEASGSISLPAVRGFAAQLQGSAAALVGRQPTAAVVAAALASRRGAGLRKLLRSCDAAAALQQLARSADGDELLRLAAERGTAAEARGRGGALPRALRAVLAGALAAAALLAAAARTCAGLAAGRWWLRRRRQRRPRPYAALLAASVARQLRARLGAWRAAALLAAVAARYVRHSAAAAAR
jgi:hypothetical protein